MPETLEMPHLPEDDRVPEVKVGRGRVEAHLHEEGFAHQFPPDTRVNNVLSLYS